MDESTQPTNQHAPHATPYQLPPRCERAETGNERRVGIEVELAGVSLERTLQLAQAVLGGEIELRSGSEGALRGARFGTLQVEFDHSILKQHRYLKPIEKLGLVRPGSIVARRIERSVLRYAAKLVPVEVVSPPLPISRLHELDPLWAALRAEHAQDTHDSPLYAFGLHLNPEPPSLEAPALLALMRAYLLLEDWLKRVSNIDYARSLSPFLRGFPESYRRLVLEPAYAPSSLELANDYLRYNPTRNRTLDLCPLLVHLHGPELLTRVREAHLVKGRPTWHYRLPNCEIAAAGWTPARDWNRWVAVERLAEDATTLRELSEAYLRKRRLPLRLHSYAWVDEIRSRLALHS